MKVTLARSHATEADELQIELVEGIALRMSLS
jgi:hypothetical protein